MSMDHGPLSGIRRHSTPVSDAGTAHTPFSWTDRIPTSKILEVK